MKDLEELFKENGVPSYCSSKLYYTMFMPKGIKGLLVKLLYIALFTIVVPGIILLLMWHTVFSGLHYDKKVLITIIIAVIWIVLFIVIYFNIYVKTKVMHLETIKEGRKYRDAIDKNLKNTGKIPTSVKKG